MTNDNLKRAIRAHMAEHGVNYTTARRALTADREPLIWTYTRHVWNNGVISRKANKGVRAQDYPLFEPSLGAQPHEGHHTEEMNQTLPLMREITNAQRTSEVWRVIDPVEVAHTRDVLAERDRILDEAEAAGITFPAGDPHFERLQYIQKRSQVADYNDVFRAEELFEVGRLDVGEYEEELKSIIKRHPGSVSAWQRLGALHWYVASGELFPDFIPDADREEITSEALTEALHAYSVGLDIIQRSMPPRFNGEVHWSYLDNRPFLRCLSGLACIHYRQRRPEQARTVLVNSLWLNPNDNEGLRYMLTAINHGLDWDQYVAWDQDRDFFDQSPPPAP